MKDKFLNEKESASIMRKLLQGVNYCHSKGVVHRDLKPENIMFSDSDHTDIKIIDFGLSKNLSGTTMAKMTSKIGSAYYISPEVIAGSYD